MRVELLLNERHQPPLIRSSSCGYGGRRNRFGDRSHDLKYALAYVVAGFCVLRYDNEAGKGDYRQIGGVQTAYTFTTPARLLVDFWNDVDQWRPE
jgi:hypothetical protein